MKRVTRKKLTITILTVVSISLLSFTTVFFISARIPNDWQELVAGMHRVEVDSLLGSPKSRTDKDGRDIRRIQRPIGDWLLMISYNDDETFHSAHLRYSTSLFGEYTRARNYSERDEAYSIRAKE